MDRSVYIHRRAKFFTPAENLTSPKFSLGYTLDDYYRGKFVRLNGDQVYYWQTHPGCTPVEAFNMRSRLVPEPGPEPEPEPIVSGSLVSGSLE